MYESVICNLLKDIDILENAVIDLSKFKEIGVKLGDAFESIDEQKSMIKKMLIQCETILEQHVQITIDIMNKIK